jgi:hypothetical protein
MRHSVRQKANTKRQKEKSENWQRRFGLCFPAFSGEEWQKFFTKFPLDFFRPNRVYCAVALCSFPFAFCFPTMRP